MNIKFKHLEFSNFMSFGEASLDLDSRGYTLISGVNEAVEDSARSNGSGKSSIFEAVVWCLTGNTLRGNKSVTNYNGTDGALVQLEFEVDGISYKLIRAKDHSEYKTTLKIFVNGADQSGKGIRDTEKLLSEYLPQLTSNLIGSVVILGQGLPAKFSNNSPSGRKEVLEKLCNTDFMIEDIKARISIRKEQLQEQQRQQQAEIVRLTTQVEMNSASLDKVLIELRELLDQGTCDQAIADLEKEKASLEAQYLDCENSITETSHRIEEAQQEYDFQLTSKRLALEAVEQEFAPKISEAELSLSEHKASLRHLQAEKQTLESSPEFCPTCNQRLPHYCKPNTEGIALKIAEENEQVLVLTQLLNQLHTDKQLRRQEIEDAYSTLYEYTTDIVNSKTALQTARNNLTYLGSKKEKVSTELATLQERVLTYKERIRRLTEESSDLRESIDKITSERIVAEASLESTNLRITIVNKLSSLASRDFRGYLLSAVITDINDCSKRYCQDVFGTNLIDFVLEGNNISIKYNNKEYESLSGGERQKIDLIIQFAIRDVLSRYTNFSSNILGLDEIFDNLDDIGCDKIIELISNQLSDISSIFIVTHHTSELNIPCDDEIAVVKSSSGVSYIR